MFNLYKTLKSNSETKQATVLYKIFRFIQKTVIFVFAIFIITRLFSIIHQGV